MKKIYDFSRNPNGLYKSLSKQITPLSEEKFLDILFDDYLKTCIKFKEFAETENEKRTYDLVNSTESKQIN
jgi:hypothetical protein